jgi:hypothetical protein
LWINSLPSIAGKNRMRHTLPGIRQLGHMDRFSHNV